MTTLICFIIFLIPVFFGAFCARRFNFIHGAIVTVAWFTIFAGIYYVFEQYSGEISWMNSVLDFLTKYHVDVVVKVPYLVAVNTVAKVSALASHKELYTSIGLFVIPVIIWLVSRLISGAVRNRRGY